MRQEIIQKAIEHLNQNPDVKAIWIQRDVSDGIIELTINQHKHTFHAEVKRELRNHQLPLIEKIRADTKNLIVIGERIFPKIKEELRRRGIAYIEGNGNFFIKNDYAYCFVDTFKKLPFKKEQANRAFTKTGLKVLFHFLLNKDLVNKTQREIADITGVGLGTIPQVIDGIKTTGNLLRLNKNTYIWENRVELLERWINNYTTVLRPKLIKGNYEFNGNWKDLQFEATNTVWGGEPAADLLTNHLRPEKLILYTKETKVDLMKKYRLVPNKEGEIEVLEPFWNLKEDLQTAPPLLIYAELILTGGKRNIETAEMIYERFIEQEL